MKKIGNTGNILSDWAIEKSGMWKIETKKAGVQVVNRATLVKFCDANGIEDMPIAELETRFIEEYEIAEKPKVEPVIVPEGYEIVSIDGVEGFYKIPQFPKKEEQKAEPKTTTKRGIENIIFDNESEGVDKFNGIGIDKFAMVGIENVKVEAVEAVEQEIVIEQEEIEKLGDISDFQDFNSEEDFPLYIDKYGVENKDRVRLYYGCEYWNDLVRLAE